MVAPCRVRPLQQMLNCCQLIDLGFVGPCYTWSNMHQGRGPTSTPHPLRPSFATYLTTGFNP